MAAKSFLVFASLFFYAWWNPAYLPLILISILFNYSISNALQKGLLNINKKYILIFGICGNLALLGFYKYTDFLLINVNFIFGAHIPLHHIVLPLGISFFTFTQIAYLVDIYRNLAKEYGIANYGLFVTFFPHLIAGPIIHHKEMMPQFDRIRNKIINYNNVVQGIFLFSIGLFKKVVIADTFAVWANYGFDVQHHLSLIEAWVTALSFTFQIYFDFSGYTDMALGSALLFNIKLPINFNSPYKALSIQDFWHRWHMTLSRFLRDYVYIPLGGNRRGENRTYCNLLGTFIIGGIWHGAGWTFVIWGVLHGCAMLIHRFWQKFHINLPKIVAWFITFNFVVVTWTFFRAKSWQDAINVLKGMFGFNEILPVNINKLSLSFLLKDNLIFAGAMPRLTDIKMFVFIISMLFIVLFTKNSQAMTENFQPDFKRLSFAIIIATFGLLHLSNNTEFIYFNF